MDYDIYPGTQTPRELEAERAFEQRLARARAAERERCAAFVHELWEYGVPAQEFAQRIRAFDS